MATIKSTNGLYPLPVHATRWVGIIFFLIIHIVGIIGTPLYVWYYGFDPAEWIAFFIFVSLSGMAITMGYHRLLAHATFRASPMVRILLLFFGASTF